MKKRWLAVTGLIALSILVGCTPEPVPGPDPTPEEPVATKYNVTIGETDGATVRADKQEAEAGETITLTITVPEDKIVKEVTSDVEGVVITKGTNNTYTFLMPKCDITITVDLEDKPQETYKLTLVNEDNVDVVGIMDTEAHEYTAVNGVYELTPNVTYLLRVKHEGTLTVTLNDKPVMMNEDYYYFQMPLQDSVLKIVAEETFKLEYFYEANALSDLLILNSETGDELDPNSITPGTKVLFSFAITSGYEITKVTLNGTEIEVTGSSFEFVMPENNVTIEIETKIDPSIVGVLVQYDTQTKGEGSRIDIGRTLDANGDVNPIVGYYQNGTRFKEGEELYLQATILFPYRDMTKLKGVTLNGEPVTLNERGVAKFTVGTENIMIVVETELIQLKLEYDPQGSGVTCVFKNADGEEIETAGRNEEVTATFTHPDPTAVLTKVNVNGKEGTGDINGNVYSFTVPQGGAVLTTEWILGGETVSLSYKVNLNITPDVKFYADTTFATPVTEVAPMSTAYMVITSLDNYVIETVTLDGEEINRQVYNGVVAYPIQVAGEDIELSLNYLESNAHLITIDTASFPGVNIMLVNGKSFEQVRLNQYRGVEGTVFYLDIYPGVAEGTVYANDTQLPFEAYGNEGNSGFKLTMPNEDVIITYKN